jgi:hypothetical protein
VVIWLSPVQFVFCFLAEDQTILMEATQQNSGGFCIERFYRVDREGRVDTDTEQLFADIAAGHYGLPCVDMFAWRDFRADYRSGRMWYNPEAVVQFFENAFDA